MEQGLPEHLGAAGEQPYGTSPQPPRIAAAQRAAQYTAHDHPPLHSPIIEVKMIMCQHDKINGRCRYAEKRGKATTKGRCLYLTKTEWEAMPADARYPIGATGPFDGPTADELAAAEPCARLKEPG